MFIPGRYVHDSYLDLKDVDAMTNDEVVVEFDDDMVVSDDADEDDEERVNDCKDRDAAAVCSRSGVVLVWPLTVEMGEMGHDWGGEVGNDSERLASNAGIVLYNV